ncbi:MAG: phosphotransferase [Bacteroidota bacterium]
MRYYYYNPFNRQYYFPEGFEKYSIFQGFYQPYTMAGHILWFVWKNYRWFRHLYYEDNAEKFLPIDQLKKHVDSDSIMAFNRGAPGVEQKLTILGLDRLKNTEFFIKYADKEISVNNVLNEGNILKQLDLDFVPKLKLLHKNDKYTLIQTEVVKGERLADLSINKQLVNVLLTLSEQNIITRGKIKTTLKCSFAHGDFCPWNLIVDNNKIYIYDWEMADHYPLGYDLFTFIFQTSFLISPGKKLEKILDSATLEHINFYFNNFHIKDWRPYLYEFANLKFNREFNKQNRRLFPNYLKLKKYAENL